MFPGFSSGRAAKGNSTPCRSGQITNDGVNIPKAKVLTKLKSKLSSQEWVPCLDHIRASQEAGVTGVMVHESLEESESDSRS